MKQSYLPACSMPMLTDDYLDAVIVVKNALKKVYKEDFYDCGEFIYREGTESSEFIYSNPIVIYAFGNKEGGIIATLDGIVATSNKKIKYVRTISKEVADIINAENDDFSVQVIL